MPRGRPPAASIGDLRARAIKILERRGYTDTTMAALAQHLGVSVRTLHRYFPTKADIVWGGLEGGVDALREGLVEAANLPLIEAISSAMASAFAREADNGSIARSRLRIIALTPELQSTRPETYAGWRTETIRFIARRMGVPVDDVVPRVVGTALQAAIAEALVWWALRNDDTEPAEAIARALSGFNAVVRA